MIRKMLSVDEAPSRKKAKLSPEALEDKKKKFTERIAFFRKRLRDEGCGNPKCENAYCRSSSNYKHKGQLESDKHLSLQALFYAKKCFVDPHFNFCEDFGDVVFNYEQLNQLENPAVLEQLSIIHKHLSHLDNNFLIKDVEISETDPSIDFNAVNELYSQTLDIEELREMLSDSMTEGLKNLCENKSKISTLQSARTLLILAENPILFNNDPCFYESMQLFLDCFCHTTVPIAKALAGWLASYPVDKLETYIYTLQQFVTIKFETIHDTIDFDSRGGIEQKLEEFFEKLCDNIWGGLQFLQCIYDANQIYNGKDVNFWDKNGPALENTIFNNDAVNMLFDRRSIIMDVLRHLDNRQSFLKHHWLYDAGSKAKILEFFSKIEQEQTIVQTVWGGRGSPYLILQVRRDNIIQDTFQHLQRQAQTSLRKPLKVKFIGEQGVDEGGVKKEFFQILVRTLFDEKFGMFIYNKENDYFWFRTNTFEDVQEFELIGMILGLAIYNNIILDIRFPNLIFKKLLNKKLDFEDFRDFDPAMAKGFEKLLEFEGDVENTFCRSFNHAQDFFGEIIETELKENGSNIPVTEENRKEYVELYSNYLMEKSIEKQFNMLKQGFDFVVEGKVAKYLDWTQLNLLICGSEKLDFEALQNSARYMDGFDSESETIKFFWEIAHELPIEDKRKLLSFCTGSDRIPIRGLSELILTISKNGDDETQLPTSHTCYNHLLLPEYKSKDIARQRIITAIQNAEGFGLI